jgi:hypothetical protein
MESIFNFENHHDVIHSSNYKNCGPFISTLPPKRRNSKSARLYNSQNKIPISINSN